MTDDGHFDENVAAGYDRDHGGTDPDLIARTTDVLVDLAKDGAALEFAIGTGRIALPLAARGVPVAGIELSNAMLAQMREKPGGADIPAAVGDMTTTRVAGKFSLVYLVFNTINNLTTQDAQIACFRNAAAHLAPGGRFVIEVGVPPLQDLTFGETKRAFALSPDHWGIDEFDVVTQGFTSNHVWFRNGETHRLSIPFRYVWPSELDLMARLAGLTLAARWQDWHKAPFTKHSRTHVSVWQKPAE